MERGVAFGAPSEGFEVSFIAYESRLILEVADRRNEKSLCQRAGWSYRGEDGVKLRGWRLRDLVGVLVLVCHFGWLGGKP